MVIRTCSPGARCGAAALSLDTAYAVEAIDFYLKLLSECKVLDKGKLQNEWDDAAPLFESQNAHQLRSWMDADELRIDLYIAIIRRKRFVWAFLDMARLAAREDLSSGIRKRALRAIGEIGTRQAAAELLHLLLETAAGGDPSFDEDLNQETWDAMATMLHHLTDLEFDQLPPMRHYTPVGKLVAAITNRDRVNPTENFPAHLASVDEQERGVSALCYAITEKQKARALLREFLANAPTTFDRFFLLLSLVRAGAPRGCSLKSNKQWTPIYNKRSARSLTSGSERSCSPFPWSLSPWRLPGQTRCSWMSRLALPRLS